MLRPASSLAAFSIAEATRMGDAHLAVRDLGVSVAFYTERLGFELLGRDERAARLGVGGRALVVLHGGAHRPRAPRTVGLYHVAIRVPSRAALARSLARLVEMGTPLEGAADHAVSEALYLADPDGLGLEIYRDRPRAEWPDAASGPLMTAGELDLQALLGERDDAPWNGLERGTDVGHVHLTVPSLEPAEEFYAGLLGFEVRMRAGRSATFLAAGGYHHHLALNTWSGVGAPAAPEGSAGLRRLTIEVPDAAELARLRDRLATAGIESSGSDTELTTRDPFGLDVSLRIA
ncbi:MAG TPA: VOC family protein [Candidatus Saccharimonadaceae bacterium]|jgi:catechol 2,3-dioxygenase|nr:VOC family protein [Candidatus Saccharimonadaceae bacterium]